MYDYDKLFGGSATAVGFPTENGVDNIIITGESYAISSTCKNMDSSIIDIASEQASAYFTGQKTADEVCKLIQSKASLYISEQR